MGKRACVVLVCLLIAAVLASCGPTGETSSDRVSRSATPPSDVKPSVAPAKCWGRIAFISDRAGNYEIYVMAIGDGSEAGSSGFVRLTDSPEDERHPTWSPDGKCLAFVTCHDGESALYVMNADGGGLTRLTENADSDTRPSWSQ